MAQHSFNGDEGRRRSSGRIHSPATFFFVWLLIVPLFSACRSTPPLPPADLAAPGWHILQGQAVWKPPGNRREIAGDLLLATNTNGNLVLQFTKDPFPLVAAESLGGRWQISFGTDEHSWRGPGPPPSRFVWFQLAPALLSDRATGPWRFENTGTNLWRLSNPGTGETLEGGFLP